MRRRWSDPGTWRKLCDSGRPRHWPELVISPQPWLVRLVAVVYVVSVALAVIAATVCGFVGFRVLRLLRTCRVTASMVAARTNDRVGLLRARSAAVRVAITERRRHRGDNATPQYDRP
ncbi:bacteriophage holin [Saccharomonospora viridis]|uniref:bacteriophage holin n=1 Tax=Saccharomonospora viridis TaxID=1852 RepID=UPI002F40DD6D